ncbi:hypothetical protein CVU37_00310 [candidate division BRC1 bacterium HGW-BRC1-1]|jgi:ABC-type glycerol-3-phosphate transport system permease component|nr:MAG: hypothetical protein CVU37_00310 [candidate division BRC1 bacterium HGW-BRC1-1]
MERQAQKADPLLVKVSAYIILIVGGITMLIPFLWMIISSLQSRAQLYQIPPVWFPVPPRWANYTEVWVSINFARYFLNSCIVSSIVTVSAVLISAMGGFSFAKYDFPGKRALFLYFIATLMIPYQVTLIPLFLIFRYLGLLDTYMAMILPGMTSAFGIFMMRQFITNIPEDLLDSARIDGAREAGIFWRVVLPNIKPALSALAVFVFVGIWNDFIWPLVAISSDELKPIQVGLASFVQQHSASWHLVMAGATCALVPVILVFLLFQRQFVAGVVLTGMKE